MKNKKDFKKEKYVVNTHNGPMIFTFQQLSDMWDEVRFHIQKNGFDQERYNKFSKIYDELKEINKNKKPVPFKN